MADRPNILWLVSDEHNPHIAGFAGNHLARTEHLDELACSGAVFEAAYCQSPLCVPSRMSILTGQYAYRCGAFGNASMLRPDQRTIPEHLAEHGYTTALIGKAHLRGPKWMGGFQHRPYGDLVVDRFCFHQPDPPETWDGRWCNHKVGRFPWAGETHLPESVLTDGVVTEEALAFIFEHVDLYPDRPWFVCAGYSRPHFPFTAPGRYFRRAMADPPPLPPKPPGYPGSLHPHDAFTVQDFRLTDFSDEIQQRTLAAYYACVDYLDDCIGELLDGLRGAGLLANTYVVYMSDHGDMAGEHGLWSKRTYYDASARVPLLISGPGITPGQSVTRPVELLDLFPTFCDMAGAPVPDGIDGKSLMPRALGQAQRDPTEPTSHRPEPVEGRRRIAHCELYPENLAINFRMARDERWKYVEFPDSPPLLFDMMADPSETTNLLTSDTHGAPLDELQRAASSGLTWEEVDRLREEEKRTRPDYKVPNVRGPVQYQLRDGRIVDADVFLYPGLEEA